MNKNENKTIIYCFLTYNDLERLDIWNKYFEDKTNFKVFIHPKPNEKNNINISKYSFPIHIIDNPIKTVSKSHISIVHATLHLLKEALNNSPNASHFLFLTQSCIPIYSFDFHYNVIIQLNKSLISFIPGNKTERYYSLSSNLKKYIPSENKFVKQQPNMLLTREDVEWFTHPTNNFTRDYERLECPDEHYFINLYLYIYNKEYIRQKILYCNDNPTRTQAVNFNVINKDLIKRARMSGCLFIRKVSQKSIIDVNSIF